MWGPRRTAGPSARRGWRDDKWRVVVSMGNSLVADRIVRSVLCTAGPSAALPRHAGAGGMIIMREK